MTFVFLYKIVYLFSPKLNKLCVHNPVNTRSVFPSGSGSFYPWFIFVRKNSASAHFKIIYI